MLEIYNMKVDLTHSFSLTAPCPPRGFSLLAYTPHTFHSSTLTWILSPPLAPSSILTSALGNDESDDSSSPISGNARIATTTSGERRRQH
ncbi:hypothetical protein PoB_007663500 [Plakobranchus ocellatus]|uniref:Uncharacterized protein n=1 Tax=Plakobranchus ocellatus TaxID=259542 RepID=A0AAV4E1C1_9GAST|nr:hypothetical protein PoB_007663500 [Plakobranchus ocellatus]